MQNIHRRDALKTVVKFCKREFREKRPLIMEVRKVKSKTILTRGILPLLKIKELKDTYYIITAEYDDFIRIYSFSQNGTLLGGENFEKSSKFKKKIQQATILKFNLPKKR